MDLQLNGRRALVTGSTAGIGLAIAQALAAEGATVVVNGRTAARCDEAIAQIRAALPGLPAERLQAAPADLSNAEGCAALIRSVDAGGDLPILVNNLGIFDPRPFEKTDDAEWTRFFEVNVMSGVRLARHWLPAMKQRHWGRIVFISSESGICPPGDMVHYGMTKSAQLSVSRGLAETCAGTGVTVNAVLPGPTWSEGAGVLFEKAAAATGQTLAQIEHDFFAHGRPTSLLKRFIQPAEVASMVAYVCSPLSSATNGAALRVEGGVVRALM